MMDDQSSDSSGKCSPDVNNEKLIVNGLFGIADDENKVENTTASPKINDDINMETEEVVETIIDKVCSENDLYVIKTTNEKNRDDNNDDCVQKSESNCFGSHMLCPESTVLDHTEQPSSFATISKTYEKSKEFDASKDLVTTQENLKIYNELHESDSKAAVVLSKGNLPSTLSLISTNYQDSSSDDSDTSDDDNFNNDDQLIDSDNENSIISVSSNTFSKDYVKTKGELDISDLPPIEDLKISVDEAKCQPVGCIKNVVDTLVIVEAFLNQPALDIDSVLFVDRGKRALGRIFDVFGPVTKPFYAVRFNDSNHIKTFDVQIKEPVYCAPQTEYASYVMVSQLMKIKGSDASWRDNNEPPCEFLDYSDDEAEKLAKKSRRQKKCTQPSGEGDDKVNKEKSPDPPSQSVVRNNPTPRSMTPRSSFQNSNNRTQQTYSPRPPNYGYGPRQFPTYAQHLSSMEYSQAYRQPYNPWYYDPMYAPRHSYPPPPPPHFMPPVYDYQSQPPMDPNNPNNRFHYPDRFN
ncbi:H/ACA ribonucleoprotein complex non-core subunit NAF1 isoform X1 [Rhopalosiphum maidis]|uniref:H/ACA ribonucleoprotein complex non-core subunit NAF1 isoform X1 n=1 Tax=Rhopalosiphum maidis TaxID=43146 RepID=UPI000EFDC409|nr:H/ACA ribonucleoprotein complex non-core subunit NAF1 isoform X1 [Rhopalosiphum maidis]